MKKFSSRGKCLCGGVEFSTKGFHRDVSSCHCIQCMKTHGNFAAYTNIEDKNLKFQNKKIINIKKKCDLVGEKTKVISLSEDKLAIICEGRIEVMNLSNNQVEKVVNY